MAEFVDPFEVKAPPPAAKAEAMPAAPSSGGFVDPFALPGQEGAPPEAAPSTFTGRMAKVGSNTLSTLNRGLNPFSSEYRQAQDDYLKEISGASFFDPRPEFKKIGQTGAAAVAPLSGAMKGAATVAAVPYRAGLEAVGLEDAKKRAELEKRGIHPPTPEEDIELAASAIGAKRPVVGPPAPPPTPPAPRGPMQQTLSKGQETGELPLLQKEQQAASGILGPSAQKQAAAFEELQQSELAGAKQHVLEQADSSGRNVPVVVESPHEAAEVLANALVNDQAAASGSTRASEVQLRNAHEGVRSTLSPNGQVLAQSPQEAASIISQAVDVANDNAKAASAAAYKEFGELPGQFHPASFNKIAEQIKRDIAYPENPAQMTLVNQQTTPITHSALDELQDILGGVSQMRDEAGRVMPRPPVTPKLVENARQRLNTYLGDAISTARQDPKGWRDVRALEKVIDEFDSHVTRKLGSTFTGGDPAAVQAAIERARKLHSAWRKDYTSQGAGDTVGRAIQNIVGRYEGQALTPEQVSNTLYGPNGAQLGRRLVKIFGENSTEMGAARQGLFSHITERPPGATAWGPEQVANRIEQFTRGTGRSLTETYLGPQGIRALQGYAQQLRQHAATVGREPNAVDRVLSSITGGEGGTPASTQYAVRRLFSEVLANNKDSIELARTLRNRFGESSPEWGAYRQGLLRAAMEKGQGLKDFGYQKIADNLKEFANSQVAREIYSAPQRDLIRELGNMHQRLIPPGRAPGWSNTAVHTKPMLDKIVSFIAGAIGGGAAHLVGHGLGLPGVAAGATDAAAAWAAAKGSAAFTNARYLKQIAKQMPLVSEDLVKYQKALAAYNKVQNGLTKTQLTAATASVSNALGKMGIDFSKMPAFQMPGMAPAQEPSPQNRAHGGVVGDIEHDPSPPPAGRPDNYEGPDYTENYNNTVDSRFPMAGETQASSFVNNPMGVKRLRNTARDNANDFGRWEDPTSRALMHGAQPFLPTSFTQGYADGGAPDDEPPDPGASAVPLPPSPPAEDYVPPAGPSLDWVDQGNNSAAEQAAERMRRSVIPPGGRKEGKTTKVLDSLGESVYNTAARPSRIWNELQGVPAGQPLSERPDIVDAVAQTGLDIVGLPGLAAPAVEGGTLAAGARKPIINKGWLRPAIKYDGKVYASAPGTTHAEAIDEALSKNRNLRNQFDSKSGEFTDEAWDQIDNNSGFLAPDGKFLDRKQATSYAKDQRQVDRDRTVPGGELDSIDLTDPKRKGAKLFSGTGEGGPNATTAAAVASDLHLPQLPVTLKTALADKPQISSEIQNFLQLTQPFEQKYGKNWVTQLNQQELTTLKSDPKLLQAITTADRLSPAIQKFLAKDVGRREFFGGVGQAVSLLANASRLGKMLERITPVENLTKVQPYTKMSVDKFDSLINEVDFDSPMLKWLWDKKTKPDHVIELNAPHGGPQSVEVFYQKDAQGNVEHTMFEGIGEHENAGMFSVPGHVDPNTIKESYRKMLAEGEEGEGTLFSGGNKAAGQAALYSTLERAIQNAPQNKMTPEQWAGWLKNQPGVKAEELGWVGMPEAKGAITKQEMLEHAQTNGPALREVEKGGAKLDEESIGDLATEMLHKDYPTLPRNERYDRLYEEYLTKAEDQLRGGVGGGGTATKYHNYQLPGGENYREMLLHTPEKPKVPIEFDSSAWTAKRNPGDTDWSVRDKDGKLVNSLRINARGSRDAITQAEEMVRRGNGAIGNGYGHPRDENLYKSPHWDEPNVLLHLRMNDREIPEVGKSLHLEELQSDLHQQGRKRGYRDPDFNLNDFEVRPLRSGNFGIFDKRNGAQASTHVFEDAKTAEQYRRTEEFSGDTAGAVPDMPFKQSWPDLGLRRAIVKAARENYDAVSWTPGAKQAERYDLSKHLDNLTYNPETNFLRGSKNGNVAIAKEVPLDKLPETVGKDVADKLLKSELVPDKAVTYPRQESVHQLSGLDLKVGGEGMKSFYDKMLVDKANAIAKKYGAKVEWKKLPISEDASEFKVMKAGVGWQVFDPSKGTFVGLPFPSKEGAEEWLKLSYRPPTQVPVLRLTPELKEQALKHGLPLFANQGGKPGAAAAALSESKSNKNEVPRPPGQENHGAEPEKYRAAGGRVVASNIDKNPSEAQKEAGNYAKDKVWFQGLEITVENAKGHHRKGVGKDGVPWSVKMPCHYGYFNRSVGADSDHCDVFLGPHKASPHAFIIDQVDPDTRKFDEHKIFVGAGSEQQALNFYKQSYSDGLGHKRIGAVTALSLPQLKAWLANGLTTEPFAALEASKSLKH